MPAENTLTLCHKEAAKPAVIVDPRERIHNGLEFLRNTTGSWKSHSDFHISHKACYQPLFVIMALFSINHNMWGSPTQNPEAPKTCSELAATISKQFTIDSSEDGLFPFGKRRLACIEGS